VAVADGAVPRLMAAGVLAAADVVDRGVVVTDASRANAVAIARVRGGGGAVLKTLPAPQLAAELAVHEYATTRPGLRRALPALLAAEPTDGWLALELVQPGTTLTDAHRAALGYPPELGQVVGRALGGAHHATHDLAGAAPVPLPWPFFALDTEGPAAFAWDEAPLRAVLEAAPEPERRHAALTAARAAWRPDCLVHTDLKWDNCLLDGKGARIIDWEGAGAGDPAWDVAGIIQEYLGYAGLMGVDLAGRRPLAAVEIAALEPLAAALRAFFAAYVEAAAPAQPAALARRAVRYAGVRLVQTSLEHATGGRPARVVSASALADLAWAMIDDPGAVSQRLRLSEAQP